MTNYNIPTATESVDPTQHQKVSLLLHYMRTQVPNMLPGLPSAFRDPEHWMMNGLHSITSGLGFGSSDATTGNDGENVFASIYQPVAALMQPPGQQENEALWLSPNYHHKGFLPINDTMVMGVSLRRAAFDNAMRLEMRPFYGQNMLSARGYVGAETSLDISPVLGLAHPGKIAVSYTEGNADLMDHSHGIDLHSEFQFSEQWGVRAGVREDDNMQLGNYVMMRWRLGFE